MISKEKISLEWINQVSKQNRKADKILLEKLIRALQLLEGLVVHGIPFVFKGGTALMLHLNSSKSSLKPSTTSKAAATTRPPA